MVETRIIKDFEGNDIEIPASFPPIESIVLEGETIIGVAQANIEDTANYQMWMTCCVFSFIPYCWVCLPLTISDAKYAGRQMATNSLLILTNCSIYHYVKPYNPSMYCACNPRSGATAIVPLENVTDVKTVTTATCCNCATAIRLQVETAGSTQGEISLYSMSNGEAFRHLVLNTRKAAKEGNGASAGAAAGAAAGGAAAAPPAYNASVVAVQPASGNSGIRIKVALSDSPTAFKLVRTADTFEATLEAIKATLQIPADSKISLSTFGCEVAELGLLSANDEVIATVL